MKVLVVGCQEKPEALARVEVDPIKGIDKDKAVEIARAANFPADLVEKVADVFVKLFEVYKGEDATLVEVNPLVRTEDGEIIALDGKVSLDENADFRHPGHALLEDKDAADPLVIGGGASAEVLAAGLDVILGDPLVKSVFVNVFGGITACDAVAKGIVGALAELGSSASKPLVVRLDGNKVEEGRAILREANHPLVTLALTMDEGADKAAELANA